MEGLSYSIEANRVKPFFESFVYRKAANLTLSNLTSRECQDHEGRGARIIDRLAADLWRTFLDIQGLLPRNLQYMRAFAYGMVRCSTTIIYPGCFAS
jgi:hypothetical protein